VDRIEVERDRRDDRGGMERDEVERRRRKGPVGFQSIARDEREADPEQQVDQCDDGNAPNLLRARDPCLL
jgi:hypothetical protein